ncbi:hypothetical protein RB195_023767 [Necator americanus]|uniref:BRCT domain-containing protein n=1 Tax=Necator americanus TaxID=51031 RepID=A0ABR1EKG9_NECAM
MLLDPNTQGTSHFFYIIVGLVAPQDADVRARALCKMKENPQTTLKGLAAEACTFSTFVRMPHSSNPQVYRMSTSWIRETVEIVSHRHLVFDAEPITALETAQSRTRDTTTTRSGHKREFCKNFSKKSGNLPTPSLSLRLMLTPL